MSRYLIILLLFFFLACLFFHNIQSFDIWWHLAAGRYILDNRAIPQVDFYSYTAAGRPWLDSQWLFQVAAFVIYRALGFNGLILVKVLILLAAFLLLFGISCRKQNYLVAVLATLLVSLCLWERAVLRPEIISFLFIAIYFYILWGDRYGFGSGRDGGSRKSIFLLPLLQIVWVNSHGLFILGLVLIWSYIVGEFIESRQRSGRGPVDTALLTVGLLTFIASFINPYTGRGVIFPFTLFTRISGLLKTFSYTIGEFQSPFSYFCQNNIIFFYKIFLVCSLASIVINIKRVSAAHLLIYFSFLSLSLLARRNIAPFVLVASPIMVKNINEIYRHRPKRFTGGLRPRRVWLELLVVFGLLFGIADLVGDRAHLRDDRSRQFRLGLARFKYPAAAASFVQTAGLSGNMFCDLQSGNYLIGRLYPQAKVFIDGRLEVHSFEFYQQYVRLLESPRMWPDIARKYNISYALFFHTDADNDKLLVYLADAPDWQLVFFDDQSVIFVKDVPANQELIASRRIDFASAEFPGLENIANLSRLQLSQIYLRRGNFYGKFGELDRAVGNYLKALGREPLNALVHTNLGIVLSRQGRPAEAVDEYKLALDINPGLSVARFNLGRLYQRQQRIDLAAAEYRRVRSSDSVWPEACFNLGGIYMEKGEFSSAAKRYKLLLGRRPWNLEARINLGVAYVRQGLKEAARKEFLEVLRQDKANRQAKHNLAKLQAIE
jgi:tetratricopeptide (TPR) repeat protein